MTIAALGLFSAVLHANENKTSNLFNCVDSTSLALNGECISQKIEANDKFHDMQFDFEQQIGDLGGGVMSTLIFHPDKMLIEVIVQEEQNLNALAAVTHKKEQH